MKKIIISDTEIMKKLNAVDGLEHEVLFCDDRETLESQKIWFRIKYPQGKITQKIMTLNEKMAMVEARIYTHTHENNSENCYVSNAIASKTPSECNGDYLREALEEAVSNALTDAGFGSSYFFEIQPQSTESIPEELELAKDNQAAHEKASVTQALDNPEVAEKTTIASVAAEPMPASGETAMESDAVDPDKAIGTVLPDNKVSSAVNPEETPQTEQAEPTHEKASSPEQAKTVHIAAKSENTSGPSVANEAMPAQTTEKPYNKNNSVEEIMKLMSFDEACDYIIPVGKHQGTTLGYMAQTQPEYLDWCVNRFPMADNIMKAAAMIIVNTSVQSEAV